MLIKNVLNTDCNETQQNQFKFYFRVGVHMTHQVKTYSAIMSSSEGTVNTNYWGSCRKFPVLYFILQKKASTVGVSGK